MVCFIVLHYMVKEETITCINNLKKVFGDKKIIIVDNFSPNNSGKELKELYKNDSEIMVLLNNENSGFAKGNNLGCEYAKENYNPDYYIVMNNDVEIIQNDFIDRIQKIYDNEKFDVLSPDIYSTTQKIHQSPKSLKPMTLEKAIKMQKDYAKRVKSKIVVPIRCYLKKIDFLKKVNQIFFKKKNINYNKKYYNVPMHGSCFIFSKKFIDKREKAFFEGTFFYFESEILDYECHLNGFKEVYDPYIKIYHHQNISTNVVYSNALKKVKFMNEQNLNSINAFLAKYQK